MGIHKITTLSAIAAMAVMPLLVSAATGGVATTTATTTTSALHEELNVPGAPVLVSSTATSVTLSWAKVTAATSYVVKYSKNSVAEAFKAGKTAVYEIETDPVTTTGSTIKDLATGNTYYFAVVALDKDNNESATNSPELSVKVSAETAVATPATASGMTATPTVASNFKLASVTASSSKALTLTFSAPLSTTTPVTLKIAKTLDNSAVAVANVTVDAKDPKNATVALAGALDPSSSYSVTIISAKDATGLTIAEGINAIKEFATSANLAVAAGTTPVVLNAAPTASGATGATLSGATVPSTATNTATGAKENLLLMLAAVLSLGIIYIARRKRA